MASKFEGIKYFTSWEFDSPDAPGSGELMERSFLLKLDEARRIAQIPFIVTSGYRTQRHHDDLRNRGYKTAKNSPHLKGWAADIKVLTSSHRYTIIRALIQAGINRIGIGRTFIHADCDPTKPPYLVWHYY